ncbi:DUF4465 domain-containing protein [Planctomyces sp. SH-PL62]|uniref:DUF4465 domain-containing protein n=1 Tax=Planctomyces sp. SH-PL62 TaxID=1636152 RepID=UPI00078C728A|nr:DUF4465 domain-containing protein [Planctomyces sp. SH-PL62]AMV38539.1 hypothetical protein VT85_13970 [Planctomyces sp. SH-PL62]
MKSRSLSLVTSLVFVGLLGLAPAARAGVVDFEDLSLSPDSATAGPMSGATSAPGSWGSTVWTGTFASGGAEFANRFADYGQGVSTWSGFGYSNRTDATTAGYGNELSAYAGSAHSGGNFGVASGYRNPPFAPANPADLAGLPTFSIPTGASLAGMFVTNTTYAALSMLNGDSFAKKFGGDSGDDADWFKLTAYGVTAAGSLLGTSVDFYLADYRFDDNSLDYVLDTWAYMDLSSLAGASQLSFNLTSSDVGRYGMNTPAYFAVDDLTYRLPPAAVPEPASLALAGAAAVVLGAALRPRRAAASSKTP